MLASGVAQKTLAYQPKTFIAPNKKVCLLMPEICRFDGIIIRMFDPDHNPPHFHVLSKGNEALINITTLEIVEGDLDAKSLAKVKEWAGNNYNGLINNWERMRNHQQPFKLSPP